VVNQEIALHRTYPKLKLDGKALYYEILYNGLAVGKVGFYSIIARTASMSYGLEKDAEGKGIATRAAGHLRDLGFEELGFNFINLSIGKTNERSQALARRLGAVLTLPSQNQTGLDKWTIKKGWNETA